MSDASMVLPEAHLVGEQPAHRVAGAGALRDVELVREEPDASAEKRAQAVGFAQVEQVQDIEAGDEIVDLVEIAEGEALEQRAFELQRPQRVRRPRCARWRAAASRPGGAPRSSSPPGWR